MCNTQNPIFITKTTCYSVPKELICDHRKEQEVFTMTIEFNRTGTERKALVKAMGEILEVKPKYLGMPSAAYQVDYFTVDKNGAVTFDDSTDSEEIENLLEQLALKGFTAADRAEKTMAEQSTEEQTEVTISMPLGAVNYDSLKNLITSKRELLRKALGLSDVTLELTEDTVSFPWLSGSDAETTKAVTHLVSALCEMSREHKCSQKEDKPIENEKHAFRCFLLRLGFIGAEFKTERKILLKNLTGSSAFKNGGAVNENSEQEND